MCIYMLFYYTYSFYLNLFLLICLIYAGKITIMSIVNFEHLPIDLIIIYYLGIYFKNTHESIESIEKIDSSYVLNNSTLVH